MDKQEDDLSTYAEDFKKLRERIFHTKKYNRHTFVLRSLINCGIGLDYFLPMLMSSFIVGSKLFSSNPPFIPNEVIGYASVETFDTSLGFHSEKRSYDFDYSDLSFEHSTGWKINEEGLYERIITIYETEGIDFTDTDKIFSMTKEEIDEKFIVTDIKTIKKNELDDDDKMYMEDSFSIVQHGNLETEFLIRDETLLENVLNSGLYLLVTVVGGAALLGLEKVFIKVFFKISIKDKLKEYKDKYVYVDDEKIPELKRIYKIMEDNMALLDENCSVESFQLRKK